LIGAGRYEEDDVEEEEEEAGPSSKQQRRAKRNKAGIVADIDTAKVWFESASYSDPPIPDPTRYCTRDWSSNRQESTANHVA
jgi:hypothetical protein